MESYFCRTEISDVLQTKELKHTHPWGGRGVDLTVPTRSAHAQPIRLFHPQLILFLLLPLLLPAPLAAQPASATTSTIPALFLSDVHLDPYHDPAKVTKLNAAPAADWPTILAQPDTTAQPADFAALQAACPVRGVDTPNALWLSSLHAIHTNAAHARFVTLSGDLLAHQFDCKYRALLPAATHADYLAFAEKTIQYVVTSLRESLPSVPIYVALGNNDSGCTDYALDPAHDEFLALTAKAVAEALPGDLSQADRDAALRDFATGGNYNVPLAAVPHARLIVLDDVFLSVRYTTCSGKPDPAPAAAQLAWLQAQINYARQHGERVWVMGHIPPGVDLYSTARRVPNLCTGGKPQMFLGSEGLAEVLAANADIVRLALFGHTHSDEMRLLTPSSTEAGAPHLGVPGELARGGERLDSEMWAKDVPVKVVASITPVNGNRPTFTLASIDPATAALVDYTVIIASNSTGLAATWSSEYTYSAAYHQPAFDAPALASLITGFQADPAAKSPASQAYLRDYFPGDLSSLLQLAWPQYACSMDHDSGQSFTACACAAAK